VGAEEAPGGGTGRLVTRRVLLTAGGLTILGIYSAVRAEPIADAVRTGPARHGPATPAGAVAGDKPRASRRLATASHQPVSAPSGTADPTTPGPARPGPATAEPHASAPGADQAAEVPMRYIDDGRMAIALTVDDGPNPIYTPQILHLLEKYRVQATFSMIGIQARTHPGVAREVASAGHLIANHTWTHLNLTLLPPVLAADQMDQATEAIHAVTGRPPDLFRAPYGAWSPFILRRCAQNRMTPLGWSVDPRDWSRPGVASIIANIMRNTRTGSIILEHDGGGDRSQTVAALTYVIPRLLAEGYDFRTP
jgi:peptidoglycan-N-acetylglucosamine deacetylase